jgi:hypothetical protein
MNRTTIFIGFIFFVIQTACYSQGAKTQGGTEAGKTNSVFSSFSKFSDGKETNLDKGVNIVTMFSLDCENCMQTAKQLGEMKKIEKLPSIYFLFLGTEEQVEDFFSVAECRFPYLILETSQFFLLLDAPYPPRVCLLNQGRINADFKAGNEFTKEKLKSVLTN